MAKTLDKDLKSKAVEVKQPISLDDIILEYTSIANELELGELTDELIERLEIAEDNANHKLLGYRYVILNNDAKIESIYKPEIEKLQGRIKKFEKVNDYLKQKCVVAAQVFGIDGKYKSDTINVSAVETVSLDTNDLEVEESLSQIRECIVNGNPKDITVETEFIKSSLTITDSPEVLAAVYKALNNSDDKALLNIHLSIEVKLALDRREALKVIKEVTEFNEFKDEIYKELLNYCEKEEDKILIPKPDSQYRKIEFKGLSTKSSYSPRFS